MSAGVTDCNVVYILSPRYRLYLLKGYLKTHISEFSGSLLLCWPWMLIAAFVVRLDPIGADDGEDADGEGEAHAQVDAVEHGLLQAAAAGEALADVGGAHEEGCADGAGDGIDGGDDGGAVRVEVFGQGVEAVGFAGDAGG